MSQEVRTKVKNKADIGKASLEDMDLYSGGVRIPAYIRKELEAKGLEGRFVSIKVINERGGHHPRGWTPYMIENPQVNPITGSADKTYKYGDLILAVKPKAMAEAQRSELRRRAKAQSSSHQNNVKEMRDRIKDSRADKHISLIEGYEENGDDE